MKKITFVGVRTGNKVSWAEGYSPRHGDSIMVNRDGQMIAAGTVNITSPDSIVNPVDWYWYVPVGCSQEPLYALTELGAPEPKTSTEHSESTREYECIGMWSLKPSPEPTLYAPYILDVLDELHRAQTKFPTWPTDPLHALAVLGEEFGELTQAMLELKNEPEKPRATIEHVRTEAIQTAAMALRLLKNMDRYDFTKK